MTASSTASAGPVAEDRTARTADGLDRAMRRVEEAVMTIRSGDPQPYIDCWADDPDVTLFGAWGPIERGHPALTITFRWVASARSGCWCTGTPTSRPPTSAGPDQARAGSRRAGTRPAR
jgi:hypothetical protein